jgi:hypothetical protein
MDATNILGLVGFGVSLISVVYTAVNHRRIRSVCCSKACVSSIDIEDTTPVKIGAVPA